MSLSRRIRAVGAGLLMMLAVAGCATTHAPTPLAEVAFESRAETRSESGLKVTAAVPTSEEANAIYGVDLASRQIQPVWIEVTNHNKEPYWLLPSGLDPSYFSTSEVAYAFGASSSGEMKRSLNRHFAQLEFKNPVYPGSTASGFVLVNRDEGYKALDIDLVSSEGLTSFTFIVLDPSFKGDFTLVDFDTLYSDEEITDIEDLNELREALERLPCCTTNEDASEPGDPLNLVLVGDSRDIFPAFIRRNWHGAEIIWSKSLLRTIDSFLQGKRYRYSPISPLYAYGRRQDLAAQKARGTIHERNHLRLWLTPMRFRGKGVWVGQISRDIGVKFTLKSPTISTHVIDPDVDEARMYLVEDLAYSQALAVLGFVKGVGAVREESPMLNLVGDPWFTDGLRAVMFFEPRPRDLSEINLLDWEKVYSKLSASDEPVR